MHKALAMFRLFSNREFFKCEVPTIQKVIESLGNNLVEETNETIIDTTQIGNEHVYETILEAEDVSSEEEFQNLKTKPDLRDKEYHKLIKHVIKRIFNNHINVSLVRMLFEKKTIAKKYINQYRLFKQLINEENNHIENDCSMFINDIDTHSETYMQREHYCKMLLSVMGFSSIFDVMTKVNTSDALKALRNNMLWLREWYKFHQMWYEYGKSADDTPCIEWTDQRLRQYINTALRIEYGVSIVTEGRENLKITHRVISPLLFHFEACDVLGIDVRLMYNMKRVDDIFDIIQNQHEAYMNFTKPRIENTTTSILQDNFNLYFTITNNNSDYVKASILNEFAISLNVSITELKKLVMWNMRSVSKKINKKITKVYYSIKKKEE